jgi:hypothetical protein
MANLKINLDSLKPRKEWKRHDINPGDNVYRVLPPFSEEANGYPYRRWVIAWMADPQSGRRRPYASPFSFSEDRCPVSEYAKALEEKRKAAEAELIGAGASKEDLKEKLKPYSEVLWQIKPKASFLYNACNKAGEVGLLELRKTAHDELKKQMMQYVTDYGQDPTSLSSDQDDSGVWFKFRREGEGTNTEYKVVKNQSKKKTPEGLVFVDDRESLPDTVVEGYDSLGYDLQTIYKRYSYDELKEVLMMNLAEIYEKFPEAVVPGFELEDTPSKSAVAKTEHVKVVQKPAANKVKIKLDDLDDDKPVAPIKGKPSAKSSEDDVFALADEILNT